jgi:hypothetical protein
LFISFFSFSSPGQSQAIALAISKALQNMNYGFRNALKKGLKRSLLILWISISDQSFDDDILIPIFFSSQPDC